MRFIRPSVVAGAMLALATGLVGPAWAASPAGIPSAADAPGRLVPAYRTVDLGTLGGGESTASDVSELGQVVGSSDTADHETRPFLWQHGKMTDLGDLGGYSARAYAINNRGQVVGSSDLKNESKYEHHAFLWQRGKMTDLGTLGGPISAAYGINDRGQVAGISLTATDGWHAFLWQRGKMTDIGDFTAGAINNRGQIVGTDLRLNLSRHARIDVRRPAVGTDDGDAVLWQRGTLTKLGAQTERATAINETGGIIIITDDGHTSLWRHGTMTALGTLGGDPARLYASDINNRDQIVGMSATSSGEEHAFLWRRGTMTDLTAHGLDPAAFVTAIDDWGRLAGSVNDHAALFLPAR